jgi:hypothetical protein
MLEPHFCALYPLILSEVIRDFSETIRGDTKPREREGRPMTLHLTDPPPPAAEEPASQPNLLIPVACGVILLLLAAVLWAQSGRREALGQVATLEAQLAANKSRPAAPPDTSNQDAQRHAKLEADLVAAQHTAQEAQAAQKQAEEKLKKHNAELAAAQKERDAAKASFAKSRRAQQGGARPR